MKETKFVVKMNMLSTQDCVKPYIKEIEKKSYSDAEPNWAKKMGIH